MADETNGYLNILMKVKLGLYYFAIMSKHFDVYGCKNVFHYQSR